MTSDPTAQPQDSGSTTSYILLVSYTAELTAVDAVMPAHRRFLDQHFASGEFLASGPRDPRTGGVILARVSTVERLQELIDADPFVRQGLASYQAVAFHPNRGPFAPPLSAATAPMPST